MFSLGDKVLIGNEEWEVVGLDHAANHLGYIYTQARVHLRNEKGETMEKAAMELVIYAKDAK